MKSKILINVDDINYISDYKKAGITAFLFALKDFSVGYNTFSIEKINKLEISNKYLLINRILDCKSIDELKKILKQIKNIKGIIYEDIGVYQLIKDMNINIELIHFQNHFGTNVRSVNFWLDRADSIFISNELTAQEINYIVNNAEKEVCLHLFGYNQVMYSRRKLLTNWSEEFEIPYKNKNLIRDKATKVAFRAVESDYGTIMYSEKIYNGKELLKLNNVKYFYINPTLIDHNTVMNYLNDIENYKIDEMDNGFLEKETIYKLKERGK